MRTLPSRGWHDEEFHTGSPTRYSGGGEATGPVNPKSSGLERFLLVNRRLKFLDKGSDEIGDLLMARRVCYRFIYLTVRLHSVFESAQLIALNNVVAFDYLPKTSRGFKRWRMHEGFDDDLYGYFLSL